MLNIIHYPRLLFVVSAAVLWAASWLGVWGRKDGADLLGDAREDFSLVLTATLTLLGLIIGFSFSMATTRYDQRKNYEEAEANAIGTAYVRADLLPPVDAANVRALLSKYLDQRIFFYTADDEQALAKTNSETARLQGELWTATRTSAVAQPTPIAALAVAGMNDVLNSQGYTQAAWWNQIPASAWFLMFAIAICCNVLIGYGSRNNGQRARMLFVLPLIVSIAFMLIADIDTPRHGLIRIQPQNLTSLQESLHTH
jgi:hypothetical protein